MEPPKLVFRPRAQPLEPIAVAGRAEVAERLAARLLADDDTGLGRLSGVAGSGLLVLLGSAGDLPWVDGVVYLGRDARAPALLLPTTREPSVAAELFERVILSRVGAGAPIAVTEDFAAGVGVARPIVRARLRAWLDRERSRW
jgi:hypothetical protein